MKNEVIVKYNEILESILIKYLFVEDIDEILYLATKRYEEIEKINKAKNCDDKNICNDKKKKKGKTNIDVEKEICSYTVNPNLRKALVEFYEMRESIKKPILTVGTITRLFNKLNKIAKNDNEKISILEKSIINNWQDIWELKNDNIKKADDSTQKRKNYCENVNTPTLKGQELEDTILSNNDLDKF
ncbi:hypothetical protein HMPREF1143_1384 [Peptoanaerobacter stomatis]|uniref:Uncharacterized protein n=1 Tax=Peptoanaerobacter stomatis TaxID=796937 RepID=J4W733_9FIRM|nr:hypothetical protein [Peptoanaerobacter stomatis]EJU21686.1 hypothetical protein HMPREF1143_1384 [Peptoanaerobacter stomatis]